MTAEELLVAYSLSSVQRRARSRIMFTTQLVFPCVILTLPAGTAANPAGTRRPSLPPSSPGPAVTQHFCHA